MNVYPTITVARSETLPGRVFLDAASAHLTPADAIQVAMKLLTYGVELLKLELSAALDPTRRKN